MYSRVLKFKRFVGKEVWKYLLLSIVVGFLWFLIESSFLFMLQGFLFTIGLLTKDQVYLPEWYPTSLSASITIMLSFGLFRALIQIAKNHLATLTQQAFICNQRIELLTLGLKHAATVSTKEIVTIFGDVVYQSGNAIFSFSQLVNVISTIIFFMIASLKIAPYEMIIGVAFLGVFLLPTRLLSKRVEVAGRGILEEGEVLNNSLLSGLRNNFFLAVYKQIQTEIDKGSKSLTKYRNHINEYSIVSSFSVSYAPFLGVVVLCLITILSVKFIHTKPLKLISFFYLFLRLAQAAGDGAATFSNVKMNIPGMMKLLNWTALYRDLEKKSELKTIEINESNLIIKANDLSFSYNDDKILFNNLNFTLKQSDSLIIKGESGSGKSTLLSILLGINLPTKGHVEINNYSSDQYHFDLQNILAYVGPEPYFISGSVKQNLLYGIVKTNDITESELWEALELMELKDFVMKLPKKLEEPIFDIPQFSTGQKQRLSFARALVRKPKILILDEATANLDSSTEERIIQNLNEVFKNCISIIVTHKPAFDKMATKEIVLGKN